MGVRISPTAQGALMKFKRVEKQDVDHLYEMALDIPELQVSSTESFMSMEEFESMMLSPTTVALTAKEGDRYAGFILASQDDPEKPGTNEWACLVYLAIASEF